MAEKAIVTYTCDACGGPEHEGTVVRTTMSIRQPDGSYETVVNDVAVDVCEKRLERLTGAYLAMLQEHGYKRQDNGGRGSAHTAMRRVATPNGAPKGGKKAASKPAASKTDRTGPPDKPRTERKTNVPVKSADQVTVGDIRAWAGEQGYTVKPGGRFLPRDILEAFEAATGKKAPDTAWPRRPAA